MWRQIQLATKILRARIAQTNKIDVVVLEEKIAELPVNLNEHYGQIICYFCTRPDDSPVLLAFIRQDRGAEISHIFAFYINTRFKIIQSSERRRFANKLPKGVRLGLEVKLGVVNAVTDIPTICHLSIILQMAEFMLNMNLVSDFVPTRQVTNCVFSSMVCFNPTIPFPDCNTSSLSPEAEKLWCQIMNRGYKVFDANLQVESEVIPLSTNILRIRLQYHVVYGIYYHVHRSLMLILPHPSLFRCREDAGDVISAIRKCFSRHSLLYIGSTRFYDDHRLSCCSAEVFKCILLALQLPLVTVKKCDIDYVIHDEQYLVPSTSSGLSLSLEAEGSNILPACSSVDQINDLHEPQSEGQDNIDDAVEVPLSIDLSTCQPIIELSQVSQRSMSSQDTVICNQIDIDTELSDLNRLRDIQDSLQHDLPRTRGLNPRDDPRNLILNDITFFTDQLSFIITTYSMQANILPLTDVNSLRELVIDSSEPLRLIIIPVRDIEGIVLIITDKQTEEWGLINPNAASQRELTTFNRVKSILSDVERPTKNYSGAQITIPCHFHSDYRVMHLLMAIYRVYQAFRYAQILPKRLTYTEKRLRCFCYVICRELQFRNADHNFRNGLVNDNGFLREGAFRSLPSPVYFERSVVATDRCLFCDIRYLKNLGAHMSMAHGGQAKSKRDRRRWKDSL